MLVVTANQLISPVKCTNTVKQLVQRHEHKMQSNMLAHILITQQLTQHEQPLSFFL